MGPDAKPEARTEFVEANGQRFEVDMAGSGDRFALLLHGFPETKHTWRYQLPLLADLGFTVWAPNLRGYGGTSRPAGRAAYRLEALVDDVAGLFAAATDRSAVSERVLVGHDWGGAISWATAMTGAVPLDKLVIMNIPHPALFARGLWRPAQLARSWYVLAFQIPWVPEQILAQDGAALIGRAFQDTLLDTSHVSKEDLEIYQAAARDPGALTAMINYYRAALGNPLARKLSQKDGPALDTPTLMLWGEADIFLGKELTYGTERFVRNLTIRYLPGVSHWLQQEAPQIVNPMLATFLEGHDVPSFNDLQIAAE